MKKLFLFSTTITIILSTTITCYADHYWVKSYGAENFNYGNNIQQTTDGGYIVLGSTGIYFEEIDNIWILKLNNSGNVIWEKTYHNWGLVFSPSIMETIDGGYIVGSTTGYEDGRLKLWLLKLDSSGNVVWQKTYDGSGSELAYSIQQSSDGGFIVAGRTESLGAGGKDIWVLKLDGSGNVDWQKTFGGESEDIALSVEETSDEGFIVAGSTESFGAGSYDIWVLKLDSNGNVDWQKTFGGSGIELAYSIQQSTDGEFIVAGSTNSFSNALSNRDFWVLKLDNNGNIRWQKTYDVDNTDYFRHIQKTTDGGYIATGGGGISVLKLNSTGSVNWQKRYDGDLVRSIQQINNGGYIVIGSNGSEFVRIDVWILKLDSSGEIPNCDRIVDLNTTITDTTVEGQDTNATLTSTAATINVTTITPQDTVSDISVFCCYDSDDLDGDCIGDLCDEFPDIYDPIQPDTDSDGIGDACDTCPLHPNSPLLGICFQGMWGNTCLSDDECSTGTLGRCSMDQTDNIHCDCKSNFDCDYDVDGTDAARFKADFGRSSFNNPCINQDPCNGDYECDGDVDGTDAADFKKYFGVTPFSGYCLACVDGVYQYDCSY